MNSTETYDRSQNAIPISVIDELIAELDSESETYSAIFTHAIIALQMLKNRWERIQKGEDDR